MSHIHTSGHLDLLAPLSGVIVPLAQVPDPVFAQGLAGLGLALDPLSSELLAPADGRITQIHPAHHALTLSTDTGLDVLLHVGIDTVLLHGEGFSPKVALGDRVRAGDVLLAFDPELIGWKGRSLLTEVLVPGGTEVEVLASGQVIAGQDPVLRVILPGPAPQPGSDVGEEAWCSAPATLLAPAGLHARPAALVAAEAKRFQSSIRVSRGTEEADAKSILALLRLGAKCGDLLQVRASGPDANNAVKVISTLLAEGCGDQSETESALLPRIQATSPDELAGVPASPGFAVGRVFQYRPMALDVPEVGRDPFQERSRLESALHTAFQQIEAIKAQIPEGADPAREAILSAHQELLADPGLTFQALESIAAGKSAGWAWREASTSQANHLASLESELLRERANDVRDVGRRVLVLLTDVAPAILTAPEKAILIAEELTPSETAQLDPERVRGLCTTTGGPTSHVGILARAMGIPALCGIDQAALDLPDGSLAVLDGQRGVLHRNPGEAVLRQAQANLDHQSFLKSQEQVAARQRAVTADGHFLEVAANVCNAREARLAMAAGAEGIGLLRTEFLFQERDQAPSESEQATEYAAVAEALGPNRRLVIRTLDVGGDKPLSYLPMPHEENPFLGMRGLRVSLERPALLRTQLRAILQAAPLADLHIMFPMVTSLEELREAKTHVAEVAGAEGVSVKVGVMIEVPSAALMADALACEADFFSIGTNDLTQYCLAMDRGHPRLAKNADPLHPAVLRLIALTVEAAHRHGRWVGICGGLASETLALPALLGLGVDELSVDVPALGAVKGRLATLERASCRILAQELLQLPGTAEVRARLQALLP
jgi:multiphosphoryl transfer protein